MSTNDATRPPVARQPDTHADPFRVTATRPTATLTVVHVVGELDLATCPEFDRTINDELPAGSGAVSDVIIDLTRLQLLSASGVHCLLAADTAARAARTRLQLVVGDTLVAHVLALLDLGDRLCLQPDLVTARRAVVS